MHCCVAIFANPCVRVVYIHPKRTDLELIVSLFKAC